MEKTQNSILRQLGWNLFLILILATITFALAFAPIKTFCSRINAHFVLVYCLISIPLFLISILIACTYRKGSNMLLVKLWSQIPDEIKGTFIVINFLGIGFLIIFSFITPLFELLVSKRTDDSIL